jgi:hypothetical protein
MDHCLSMRDIESMSEAYGRGTISQPIKVYRSPRCNQSASIGTRSEAEDRGVIKQIPHLLELYSKPGTISQPIKVHRSPRCNQSASIGTRSEAED